MAAGIRLQLLPFPWKRNRVVMGSIVKKEDDGAGRVSVKEEEDVKNEGEGGIQEEGRGGGERKRQRHDTP